MSIDQSTGINLRSTACILGDHDVALGRRGGEMRRDQKYSKGILTGLRARFVSGIDFDQAHFQREQDKISVTRYVERMHDVVLVEFHRLYAQVED